MSKYVCLIAWNMKILWATVNRLKFVWKLTFLHISFAQLSFLFKYRGKLAQRKKTWSYGHSKTHISQYSWTGISEVHPELCQTSEMELFEKMSILDVCDGSEYDGQIKPCFHFCFVVCMYNHIFCDILNFSCGIVRLYQVSSFLSTLSKGLAVSSIFVNNSKLCEWHFSQLTHGSFCEDVTWAFIRDTVFVHFEWILV